eukprot:SAG11_NODE_2300_length_3551_cov_1.734067_2_plen_367_part_00
MVQFSSVLFAQIRYLDANLYKKNAKNNTAELNHLVELYGHDARLYLLRCLVDHIDFRDQKSGKDALKVTLLNQELAKVSGRQNFVSIVCQALENVSITEDFLQVFVKMVKLSLPHQVALALALAHSLDVNVQDEAGKFLKNKLSDPNAYATLPKQMHHDLLFFLRTREGFTKQRATLMSFLHSSFPQDEAPAVLSPLMFADSDDMCFKRPFVNEVDLAMQIESLSISSQMATACSAADLMKDLGYSCTSSVANLEEVLAQYPNTNEEDLAHIVGMMASTHTGLDDSLNLQQTFITSLQAPTAAALVRLLPYAEQISLQKAFCLLFRPVMHITELRAWHAAKLTSVSLLYAGRARTRQAHRRVPSGM